MFYFIYINFRSLYIASYKESFNLKLIEDLIKLIKLNIKNKIIECSNKVNDDEIYNNKYIFKARMLNIINLN
jgi:hypothetical protein